MEVLIVSKHHQCARFKGLKGKKTILSRDLGQIHLLLTDGLSIKCVWCKSIFFHFNLMKLGEVVVHIEHHSFTKFHYILMKKIIVSYQTHLTDGLLVRGRWIGPFSKSTVQFIDIYLILYIPSLFFQVQSGLILQNIHI